MQQPTDAAAAGGPPPVPMSNVPYIATNPNLNNEKLFPPLKVNRGDYSEKDSLFSEASDNPLPLIPPKNMAEEITIPPDPETVPSWFAVLSPREKGGLRTTHGPYTVPQMKDLYRTGTVKDSTLVWHEGDKNWQQVLFQRYLRPKLLQMPIVPAAFMHSAKEEPEEEKKVEGFSKSTFNPILDIPSAEELKNIEMLRGFEVTNYCSRCGAFAAEHMASIGEQIPDLSMLRNESKLMSTCSNELLPGFLWIGNQASAKTNHIHHLEITLVLNCAQNISTPSPMPPAFRCKSIPLKEKPTSEVPKHLDQLLDIYSQAYDFIEFERLHSERNKESDAPAKRYMGPTDCRS